MIQEYYDFTSATRACHSITFSSREMPDVMVRFRYRMTVIPERFWDRESPVWFPVRFAARIKYSVYNLGRRKNSLLCVQSEWREEREREKKGAGTFFFSSFSLFFGSLTAFSVTTTNWLPTRRPERASLGTPKSHTRKKKGTIVHRGLPGYLYELSRPRSAANRARARAHRCAAVAAAMFAPWLTSDDNSSLSAAAFRSAAVLTFYSAAIPRYRLISELFALEEQHERGIN